MDSRETYAFAESLMRQVWKPLDSTDVPQFYHRDIGGHHRSQELNYDDTVNRIDWDKCTFSNPVYDIRDIIATEDKFAIRFLYTATEIATGEEAKSEAYYFYHLKDGKISEFWLLANIDFDYRHNFEYKHKPNQGAANATSCQARFCHLHYTSFKGHR